MIVAATSTFSVALLISGATVMIGGLLYLAIILHERAKLNKLIKEAMAQENGGLPIFHVLKSFQ